MEMTMLRQLEKIENWYLTEEREGNINDIGTNTGSSKLKLCLM